MSLETEFKIRISSEDLDRIRTCLRKLHGHRLSESREEANLLFDFPDQHLTRSGCALRLRTYGDEAFLTFKGKVLRHSVLKRREEFEAPVREPGAAREILEALGLQLCFEYSKFRETHRLDVNGQQVLVCLDQTPVGTFVEIEGPEKEIQDLARKFGWQPDSFIQKTYVELYEEADQLTSDH